MYKKLPNNMNMAHVYIPSEWSRTTLGKISKIYDGTHQTPNYVESGVPFYSVEHVTANDFSHTKFISEDVYARETVRTIIEKGDILMTRIGDVGTARHIDWDIRASFYVSLALIKCKKDVNSKFVSYLINSYNFQRELWQKTIHVAFPNKINLGDIGRCGLLMPPLHEQDRIATVLGAWDRTVQNLKKSISLKKVVAEELINQLLSGKRRLSTFSSTWNTVEIGDIAKQVSIKNVKGDILTVLSCTKYSGLVRSLEYFGRQVFGENLSTYKVIKRNQFAYATNHIEEGSLGYQNLEDTALISPMYTVFQTLGEVDDYFLYSLLKTPRMIFLYQSNMSGSIARRGGLRWGTFSTLPITIPNLEEQRAIGRAIKTTRDEINLLEKKLHLIERQRKFLLNNLVTGKMRTPENLMAHHA